MHKKFSEQGFEDYIYWQSEDKKTLRRINNLLKDIDRNGYNCIGKPEKLKGDFTATSKKAPLYTVGVFSLTARRIMI